MKPALKDALTKIIIAKEWQINQKFMLTTYNLNYLTCYSWRNLKLLAIMFDDSKYFLIVYKIILKVSG